MDGILVLQDGTLFEGTLRGAKQRATGEVIFNTSMTGYQEILTDPSYSGQLVTMTYPHIGNYGSNAEDVESRQPFLGGMIVKELSRVTSNWRAEESLEQFLERKGVTVLEGIDTRALVKHVRQFGSMPGIIAPAEGLDEAALNTLKAEAAAMTGMEGQNLAAKVSTPQAYQWDEVAQTASIPSTQANRMPAAPAKPFKVVAYDFGIKYNILREMTARGMSVEVVPQNTSAEAVLAKNPDGVFLSNGPGDPEPVTEAAQAVQTLLGKVPIFGICLGHQILSRALGAQTYKLKFGHHGGNHPVLQLANETVEITAQNHGFAVDAQSLPPSVKVTHRSLNDETVEGIQSLEYPAFSVQYHPEASPGPHDSSYLFDRFMTLMKEAQ